MKRGGKLEICALAVVLLSTGAKGVIADKADQPYQGIVERNVFNLHAPPPPINPADLIKHEPPPKVTFTGITTILGRKLAFLTVPGTKPGALPDSMMLAEGQAQNDIEVKEIDDRAGVVKISNHGQPETLDFDHNGAKPFAGPGGPPPAATAFPRPALPPPNVTPAPGNVIRPLRTLPTRGTPFSGGPGGLGGDEGSAPLTPEEQVALIEVQRVKFQQDNNPVANLLPPTEMTQDAGGNPAPQPQ
jgi:hypothetical protein